jgi:hypothetical protein
LRPLTGEAVPSDSLCPLPLPVFNLLGVEDVTVELLLPRFKVVEFFCHGKVLVILSGVKAKEMPGLIPMLYLMTTARAQTNVEDERVARVLDRVMCRGCNILRSPLSKAKGYSRSDVRNEPAFAVKAMAKPFWKEFINEQKVVDS